MPPLRPDDFDATINPIQSNFVMQHAKLCATVSDLVRSHFSVRASRSGVRRSDALEVVDSALADWLVGLPPELRENSAQRSTDTGPWPLLLHLTYYTILIQFHRPLSSSREGASVGDSSSDDEICADAASNIIRIFEHLCQRSALHHCWFWTYSTLFAAMLQISGELKCKNPILALGVKKKYESGLHSLRGLSRHWLFAVSVLRLFQSNASKPTQQLPGRLQHTPTIADQTSPEGSSLAMLSPVGWMSSSVGSTTHLNMEQPQPREMEWIQPFSFGSENTGDMDLERNRWQSNLNDWQSRYWSDPLANIYLEDNFGRFQWDGLA